MINLLLLFSLSFANNIILFIGDGMGPSVISAARSHYYKGETKLHLDQFSNIALVTTHSKDNHVTDSAAAASAIFCGKKYENYNLCHPKVNKRLSEIAKDHKYQTGIITNTTITHATPAALFASVVHRKKEEEIIDQLMNANIDFIIGGNTARLDQALNKQKRFNIYKNIEDMKEFKTPFIGLLSSGHFAYLNQEKSTSKLQEVTLQTLKKLISSKDRPFFLVIEGGRIDHALHKGNIPTALKEMHDFDQMIGKSLKLLKDNNIKDKTSVFVTSDHDTAGIDLSGYPPLDKALIKDGEIQTSKRDDLPVLRFKANGKFSQNHTGVAVHFYGSGPCADKINGTIDNTQIYQIIKSCIR